MTSGISVVTPTFRRPGEVAGLCENLSRQTRLPLELVLVDGSPASETATEQVVAAAEKSLPFRCRYLRHGGGTAIQRNVGIDHAEGQFIAFVDDDIRLEPDFFEVLLAVFDADTERRVGGITGNEQNEHFNAASSRRWRWYRRLGLFTTYEPGRYDFESGYPINRKMHPPHDGVRPVDFFGTSNALWRREVFDSGLRFGTFFADYGVLEDAHFALRAGRTWRLLECGRARSLHLRAPGGRVNKRRLAWKSAVNYRYVFLDMVPRRSWRQELRFWRVQMVDLVRLAGFAVAHWRAENWGAVAGKIEGMMAAARLPAAAARPDSR